MQFCAAWWDMLLEFILLVAAVFIGLGVERNRRPKLILSKGPSTDAPRNKRDSRSRSRWLHVAVSNQRMPSCLGWALARDPAQRCKAIVRFWRNDGTPLFPDDDNPQVSKPMLARWSGLEIPQPVDPLTKRFDFSALSLGLRQDIGGGEDAVFNVAVATEVNGKVICYGWTYDGPYWYGVEKQPDEWIIPEGTHLVQALVTTGGMEFPKQFQLTYEGSVESLDLEEL